MRSYHRVGPRRGAGGRFTDSIVNRMNMGCLSNFYKSLLKMLARWGTRAQILDVMLSGSSTSFPDFYSWKNIKHIPAVEFQREERP
jgi:hypothetical protein